MLEPKFTFGKDLGTGMLALPVVFGCGVVALVRMHLVLDGVSAGMRSLPALYLLRCCIGMALLPSGASVAS